jgi:GDP-L-fucose synthase
MRLDRENPTILMNTNSKIFVAGHRGLVGNAVLWALRNSGHENIVTVSRDKLDLRDPVAVKWFFSVYEPEYVFLCAAKVGGIAANMSNYVDFFCDNMSIEQNVIMNAAEYGTKKLLFLGSNCIYPRDCPQPIKESYLMTGPLEATNEAYAVAKIAGVKLCQWLKKERGCNFVSAMPCNVFGPGDDFDLETAHVIPGMMARMDAAIRDNHSIFEIWGTPDTKRECIFSEDLAQALIYVMKYYNDPEPINTGSGMELDMLSIAKEIAGTVGFTGTFWFDKDRPSGTPRKLLDNSKIFSLGWKPAHSFKQALKETYAWMVANRETA